jgi:hypothetical protein
MSITRKKRWGAWTVLVVGFGALAVVGCYHTQVDVTQGPAPLQMPPPDKQGEACCYEDGLNGGHVFAMYCGSCHNARTLAERPFSNYKNVAAHMRTRANLTGKEYAELVAWMRRWHDVPPPDEPVEPSPKRLIFSQPINELRESKPPTEELPKPKPAGPDAAPGIAPR